MTSSRKGRRLRSRKAPLSAQLLEDRALLATIAVTTFDDVVANDGEVSLREAITQANGSTAADEILLQQGTYTLSLTGDDEDQNASGDLDLLSDITIRGAGSDLTFIDAGGNDGINERVMSVRGTTVLLQGLTLTGGRSENPGGGIFVANGVNSSLMLSAVHVTGNSSTDLGGGVYILRSNVTISQSTVSQNTTSEFGGGIYNTGQNSTLVISASTISNNSSEKTGGGVESAWGATTTIDSSTISNNSAGWAGGVGNFNSKTAILNSTISGNTGINHGAILTHASTHAEMVILQTTIANNDGRGSTSQIRVGTTQQDDEASPASSILRIGNSLVAGNTGTENTISTFRLGSVISLGHNLFDDDGNGFIIAASDQTSVATPTVDLTLRDNGGPTFTHALLPGSTAINGGNNALAVNPGADHVPGQGDDDSPIEFAQRGSLYDRINDDTVDIGAFEQHAPIAFLSTQSQTLDEADGVTSFDFWFTTDVPVAGTHSIETAFSGDLTSGEFELTPSAILQIEDGQQTSNVLTFTVTDDELIEDLETATFSFSNPSIGGIRFAPDSTLTVSVQDDDQAGFELSETQVEVSETGGTSEFSIVLAGRPANDVVIDFDAENPSAATVGSEQLTFTTENWDTPQTVVVTGVDDFLAGARTSSVDVSINQPLSDTHFRNLAQQSLRVTTTDSPEFSFDVDDSDGESALTDGILLVRYLAGFSGVGLTASAIDETSGQRLTSDEITEWLGPHRTNAMDIDGDGQTTALGDGILMLRYLAGFTGDALISGVVADDATRTRADQIKAWLDQFTDQPASGPVAAVFAPIESAVGTTLDTTDDAKGRIIRAIDSIAAVIASNTNFTQATLWRSLFEVDSIPRIDLNDATSIDEVFTQLEPLFNELSNLWNFGESPGNGI